MRDKDIIRKYLGIPFKRRGRAIEEGLDCWGLIKAIYADCGIDLFDLDSYEVDWPQNGRNHFMEYYCRQWEKVDRPQFMDVVLFRASPMVVNHAGLVLSESRFIHAARPGVVVSRLGELQVFKKIEGYYRFKNDQDKVHSQ